MAQFSLLRLMPECDSGRLLALDAYRGLVVLLLVPDVYGGLSLHQVAGELLDSPVWTSLTRQFTHAQWSGCSLWDLIMPSFLFIVGASISYSHANRRARGDSEPHILAHALARAFVLLLLGVVVQVPVRTWTDSLCPFLLLGLGLHVPNLLGNNQLPFGSRLGRGIPRRFLWAFVLLTSGLYVTCNFSRIEEFALHDIFPQLALSYMFAVLLVGRRPCVQAWTAFGILAAWWLAFFVYPLPPSGTNLAQFGIAPGDEIFTGYFAHWNKNTNLATAFDTWFLNLFPRSTPFQFNPHGYQTLNFVPSIATILFGVLAGEHLRRDRPRTELRNGLALWGVVFVLTGQLAGCLVCPIVKSIWTPSWTLFSAGCALIVLAACDHLVDVCGRGNQLFPLVVLGRNPLLLYTLGLRYRWWILEIWRRTLPPSAFAGTWGPLKQSLACLVTLWFLALMLHRLRLYIRL